MAWIKIKQPKRTVAASQVTPRPQKKRSSAPAEPSPLPDIPSPLAELPAEGSRGAKQKLPAGSTNPDIGNRDFSDSSTTISAPRVTGRRGGKRSGTQR